VIQAPLLPFHTVNIKLNPSLRNRDVVGPRIFAKAGPCCLRKWPQSKMLYSLQDFGMKITALVLFEGDIEGLGIKFSACVYIANDWTKSGNE
jgi:hypothetical protein